MVLQLIKFSIHLQHIQNFSRVNTPFCFFIIIITFAQTRTQNYSHQVEKKTEKKKKVSE